MRFDEASQQACFYFVPRLSRLAGYFVFGMLFVMFSMSTCGELTSVPQRRHLAGLFVLLAGCSFFQQYSAVQLHQVTAATNRKFELKDKGGTKENLTP